MPSTESVRRRVRRAGVSARCWRASGIWPATGGADVVRRRPDRDDFRHAAGAVPPDGASELRRPDRGGTTMALLAAAISVGAVAGGVFSGWFPRVRRQGLAVVVGHRRMGPGDGRVRRGGQGGRRPGRTGACGSRWRSWPSEGRPTWCRRRFGRRSCRRWPPTICAAGCRECSWWSSPAVRGWPTRCTARPRRWWAPRSAARRGSTGRRRSAARRGGCVPVFVRYRVEPAKSVRGR